MPSVNFKTIISVPGQVFATVVEKTQGWSKTQQVAAIIFGGAVGGALVTAGALGLAGVTVTAWPNATSCR